MSTRREGYQYITKEERYLDLEGESALDAIMIIQEAAEGLTNTTITGRGWEDDRHEEGGGYELTLVGDRPATEPEIKRFQEKERKRIDQEQKQARERREKEERGRQRDDEAALRRARKAFPELFKEGEGVIPHTRV